MGEFCKYTSFSAYNMYGAFNTYTTNYSIRSNNFNERMESNAKHELKTQDPDRMIFLFFIFSCLAKSS